eukprot:UN00126
MNFIFFQSRPKSKITCKFVSIYSSYDVSSDTVLQND